MSPLTRWQIDPEFMRRAAEEEAERTDRLTRAIEELTRAIETWLAREVDQ